MNLNDTVLRNVNHQTIAHAVKIVIVDSVDQNVIQEIVRQDNFAKEMSALKDVNQNRTAPMIWIVKITSAKIHVKEHSVVKMQSVDQQIIAQFVSAPTD